MNKLILSTVAIAVASLGSIASADRGDRGRGGDYHRGSDSRGSRDYGRDRGYDRGGDRGRDYGRSYGRDYGRSRSSFSFSLGVGSDGYRDSSFFGIGYSRGYDRGDYVRPRYYSSSYYYAPAPVYIAPPPVVYERYYAPTYYAPTYYAPVYSGGGYYCR